MQDLDQIRKINSEAHERDIPNQQANGKYVVAEYHGLHYIGYTTHDSEVQANAKACEIGLEPGRRAKVFTPTHLAAAVQRAEQARADDSLLAQLGVPLPVIDAGPGNVSTDAPTQVDGIVSGTGGSFAGAGAEASWASSDTSTCDSNGGLTD